MAKRDLAKMSVPELEKLIATAQAEIQSRKQKDHSVLEVIKLMEKLGLSVDDIGTRNAKPVVKKTVEVKYRDPKNPENTWTGRGKRPRWLAEAINAGKKLESFAI